MRRRTQLPLLQSASSKAGSVSVELGNQGLDAKAEQQRQQARERVEAKALQKEAAAKVRAERVADRLAREKANTEVKAAAVRLGRSRETVSRARKQLVAQLQTEVADGQRSRFASDAESLQLGQMKDAALGVAAYLCVDEEELNALLSERIEGQPGTGGLPALRREFEAHGTEVDRLCMRYVLDGEAGSCDVVFPNGNLMLDCNESGAVHAGRLFSGSSGKGDDATPTGERGWRLADFAQHPKAKLARLSLAETAALRLYTTAAYQSINAPLRDLARRKRDEPHPLPVTVMLISKGVSKLKAVGASGEEANMAVELYRGIRNRELPKDFLQRGGSELAPMSTTSDIGVALSYSASSQGVLFRLRTHSSMERGADLTFLSAFPGERECLFPPLTYLQPAKPAKTESVHLGGATFIVVEVEPKM